MRNLEIIETYSITTTTKMVRESEGVSPAQKSLAIEEMTLPSTPHPSLADMSSEASPGVIWFNFTLRQF